MRQFHFSHEQVKHDYSLPRAYAVICGRFNITVNRDYLHAQNQGKLDNVCLQQFSSTVHSRYLGSKKPLGGFYHYINIGSFFLMFLDKYGIVKLLYVMYFSINMSGVEDNVENYQTYLISCSAVMVSSPMESFFFFSFCHSYLDHPHDFQAQLCFHTHFIFTAHTSLGCINV